MPPGIESRLLPVGSQAPGFSLPDFSGKVVRSSDLLALGPLVINFFRGRWCPYCVTELETWRDLYPGLRERGAMVIGISPQTQRQSDFTASHHQIPFPLLSDPGCAVAGRYGLVWTLPDYMQRYYRGILLNIPFINGDDSWKLPIPATYVSIRMAKSSTPRATPTSASAPSPKRSSAPLPAFARSE